MFKASLFSTMIVAATISGSVKAISETTKDADCGTMTAVIIGDHEISLQPEIALHLVLLQSFGDRYQDAIDQIILTQSKPTWAGTPDCFGSLPALTPQG